MAESDVRLPRVTIQFCTQCKWNLRAAYFAQELLQTFSTTLGEVSLQPSTGGVFKIDIYHLPLSSAAASPPPATITRTPLWDRATDGGFPETKELKRRVRDVVEPGRNLGHVDRDYGKGKTSVDAGAREGDAGQGEGEKKKKKREDGDGEKEKCEDCQ